MGGLWCPIRSAARPNAALIDYPAIQLIAIASKNC